MGVKLALAAVGGTVHQEDYTFLIEPPHASMPTVSQSAPPTSRYASSFGPTEQPKPYPLKVGSILSRALGPKPSALLRRSARSFALA